MPQFRPYFEPDHNRDRQSLQNLNQTIGQIGNDWTQIANQRRDDARRQQLYDLQLAREGREAKEFAYNYEQPFPGEDQGMGGPMPSSQGNYGTMGPQPQSYPEPNMSMANGYQGYVPQDNPSAPPVPVQSHLGFMDWKQKSKNPMSGYRQIPGAKYRSEAMLFDKDQSGVDAQRAQAEKDRAMAAWYNQGRPATKQSGPGKAPPGYRFLEDGSMEAIPGGPAYAKQQDEVNRKQTAVDSQNQEATMVLSKIDSAMGKVSNLSAGLGSYTAGIPGSSAADLDADLDSIVSTLGLAKLAEMKANSKAGASGMGALSDREMTLLTSNIASLKQTQSPAQLRKSLENIKTHYNNILKMNQGINPFPQSGGTNQRSGAPSGKIRVSNGSETLYIDPMDAAEAAKDGYNTVNQ